MTDEGQEIRTWPISVKLEPQTGGMKVTVHTYGDVDDTTYMRAVEVYLHTCAALRAKGVRIANDWEVNAKS